MNDIEEIEQLKRRIFKLVQQYYVKNFKRKEEFKPGESRINYAGRVFDEKELLNLIDSSLEFWLTEGRYTTLFQKALASFLGLKYCLVTNSGSSANLLAIAALTSQKIEKNRRLEPGDEVITVAAGFPTTVFPIIQNKAHPVFIDIELDTYNIDITKLEKGLSDKTKAVFLGHCLGNPFDIDNVKKFCEKNSLWLVEDNCDSLGALYRNRYTGTFGDISTCSFYPAHQITMGEGGAVLTNNPTIYRILNSLREWGRDCWCAPGNDNTCKKRFNWQLGTLPHGYDHKYTYSEFGYNLKITDMQAAIGLAQLEKLPSFIEARRKNHKMLYEGLETHKEQIFLPETQKNSNPSWFGFMITLKNECKLSRAKIIQDLEFHNIQTRLLFAGNIIRQPVFDKMRTTKEGYRVVEQLINTDKVIDDSFWIGVYPGMTEEMICYMVERISELLDKLK